MDSNGCADMVLLASSWYQCWVDLTAHSYLNTSHCHDPLRPPQGAGLWGRLPDDHLPFLTFFSSGPIRAIISSYVILRVSFSFSGRGWGRGLGTAEGKPSPSRGRRRLCRGWRRRATAAEPPAGSRGSGRRSNKSISHQKTNTFTCSSC